MAVLHLEKVTTVSAGRDEREQLDEAELLLMDAVRAYLALASILGEDEAGRRVFEATLASAGPADELPCQGKRSAPAEDAHPTRRKRRMLDRMDRLFLEGQDAP